MDGSLVLHIDAVMQEEYPSLSLQQTANPPPNLTISDDWVFGITPDRGCAPQPPAAVQTHKQEHSTAQVPQGTASHAELGQSEAPHHSQPGSVFAESAADAEAGDQEASLAASLVAVSTTAQPADACTARAQIASPPASSVAVSSSAQPADAVPASVKEAVDRFESWTLAQAAVMPRACLADASAAQTEPLLAHTQQHMEQMLLHQTWALQQTQHLPKQQQQQRLPTIQQEQAVLPWHGSGVSLSTEPTPVLSVSLSGDESAVSCLPALAYYRQQEALRPLSQSHQQAPSLSTGSVCMPMPSSCLQPAPAWQQQPQSSASTFIEATLAAINADQSMAAQEPRGPFSNANDSITSAPNRTADVAPQATSALSQADRPAAAASSSAAQPLRPVEGCAQRPPLPAKRAGQVYLTRPRFADAFANPSLYQQPWLQGGPCSAGADSAPRSHTAEMSQAQWAGNSSGPPVHSHHATAQREATSSGCTAHTGIIAVAGGAQHPSEPQRQADSDSTTLLLANRAPSQALVGDATCSQGLDHDRKASRADATEQSAGEEARHNSRGGDVGEPGKKGSRWSAVNAYRQAREAAVRAAAGNVPDTVRAAAGADPTETIPKLCSSVETNTYRLSQQGMCWSSCYVT